MAITAQEVADAFSNNFTDTTQLDGYIKLMGAFLETKGAEANARLAENQANAARNEANQIIQEATTAANLAQAKFDALAAQMGANGN